MKRRDILSPDFQERFDFIVSTGVRQVGLIQKWLTKKVLDSLQTLSEEEPDKFQLVWEQFGRALKEGVSSDYENKARDDSNLEQRCSKPWMT